MTKKRRMLGATFKSEGGVGGRNLFQGFVVTGILENSPIKKRTSQPLVVYLLLPKETSGFCQRF